MRYTKSFSDSSQRQTKVPKPSQKRGLFFYLEKGDAMALTEEEEGKVRAIIAIFDGMAPSLSDDVAQKSKALYQTWDGGGHAYAQGERVTFDGSLYTCNQAHTSQADWSPTAAPSLWAKHIEAGTSETPDAEDPEWVQPDSTNPYPLGARVRHNGKIWESLVANNVWEPGVVGTETVWRNVTEG